MSMRKIYRKIARENGVSVKEVKEDMQAAITAAYQNPPKDGGVTAAYQRQWEHSTVGEEQSGTGSSQARKIRRKC